MAKERPRLLTLRIADTQSLYQCYMPFLQGGGLFVPGLEGLALGDEVFLLLALLDKADKFALLGRVAWLTPPCAQNSKKAGVGFQFAGASTEAKESIENLLAGAFDVTSATYTF